jgi:UDP-glucose 4-epimerase
VKALGHLQRGGASDAFNLGNGRPHTVLDVIRAVERVSSRRIAWTPGPRRAGDPAVLYASNVRVRQTLGWEPRYDDLHLIVDTAWRWHRAHPHGYAEARG